MNQHYLYLLIDFSCILIPFIASFHPKIRFNKEWKYFLPAMLIVAAFFLIWDEWFTQIGVWGFNPEYLTGIYVGHLPLEEVLFFICIPYACVFTFFCVEKLWPNHPFNQFSKIIWVIITVFAFMMSISQVARMYTFTTFVLLLITLLLFLLIRKRVKFATIFFSYLIITPFFLASNGLLTGSLIHDQVVWYDNLENIGIRIGTIPFEDFYYGFLLIFQNIVLYKLFKGLSKNQPLA